MVNSNDTLSAKEFWYLNDIVAKLYSDADEYNSTEKAFKNFLENLKVLIPFEKGEIYFCNYHHDSIQYEDFIFYGWSKKELDAYHKEEVYNMDEVLPIVANASPVVFRSADVFIQSEREKTKYYKDVVHPIGIEQSVEGNIYFEENKLSGISIHRSENHPGFTPKALEAIRYVRPHLINVSRRYNKQKSISGENALKNNPIIAVAKDINYCIFDGNLNYIEGNIDNMELYDHGTNNYSKCESIEKKIAILLKENKEHLKREGISYDEMVIAGHKYFVDVESHISEAGQVFYEVIIHDFAKTINKMLLEVKKKYNLSPRESDVMECIIRGLDTAEISEELYISIATVKKHLLNIYQKLNVKGRHQILSVVLQNDTFGAAGTGNRR